MVVCGLRRQCGWQQPESVAGIVLIMDLPLVILQALDAAIGSSVDRRHSLEAP